MCRYGLRAAITKIRPYFSLHIALLESGKLDYTIRRGAINKDSVRPLCCCYNWFLAADFRPDSPFPPLHDLYKKFSSCFLNSYIIQTHFRMKPPVAVVGQTEVICFRSYQSHSLETGNGFSFPPFLYSDIFVCLQHNRVEFRPPLCNLLKSSKDLEFIVVGTQVMQSIIHLDVFSPIAGMNVCVRRGRNNREICCKGDWVYNGTSTAPWERRRQTRLSGR